MWRQIATHGPLARARSGIADGTARSTRSCSASAPCGTRPGTVTHYVGVGTEISSLKEYEARLHHQAHHDALTGLPNRVLFQERFDQALAQARRSGTSETLAVLFLDLDHFKTINDTLGHAAGDLLLEAVAERARGRASARRHRRAPGRRRVRACCSTTSKGPQDAAVGRARAPRRAGARRSSWRATSCSSAPSIGISVLPERRRRRRRRCCETPTPRCTAPRTQGRNNCQFFTPEMNARALRAPRCWTSSLRHALERDELALHYQPQVRAGDRARIIGVEALLRWRIPSAA